MRRLLLLAAAVILLLTPRLAHASLCRLYLASQYDWGANTGFYLDFEGAALADLPVILGVADGSGWRFPQHQPGFVTGRDYQIRALVASDRAQLFLDGALIADSPGGFLPAPGDLEVASRPAWAIEPGDWVAVVTHTTVAVTRGGIEVERRDFDSSQNASRPIPLHLFEPGTAASAPLAPQPGDTVAIDVSLRFASAVLGDYAPFIDRYGQSLHADWPEKVLSDADLTGDIAREDARLATMPPSPDFDAYGGYLHAGWQEPAAGYFRVAKRDGFWWLITPQGNPCIYLGLSVAPANTWPLTPVTGRESLFQWLPPKEEPWAPAWTHDAWGAGDDADYLAWHAINLIRKYGPTWSADSDARTVRRFRSWGFSGGSKWGSPPGLVSTPVLGRWNAPSLVDHPDIFDPAMRQAFRDALAAQITPYLDDPLILGWTVGSEREELIKAAEITAIMPMAAAVPAKRALLDYAVDTLYAGSLPALASAWGLSVTTRDDLYAAAPAPPAADVEKMRLFYAENYYEFTYTTVKSIDPNHLYLGAYLCPVCADSEPDLRLLYQHCDVMGYDLYSPAYGNERVTRLQQEFDKPIFFGEFSYPATYDGWRGFGRFNVYARDDADSGEKYRAWVRAAALDPHCVGGSWFKYRDQPLTGRGPGFGPGLVYGEHFAFGLITQTDRPKWDLVERMRAANLQAAKWRLAASGRPFPDVPPGFWAALEIAACVLADVVGGYPDGTYQPLLAVKRDQMAVYIARALAGGDAFVPTGPYSAPFPDVPAHHWARPYIQHAVARSIVLGHLDGLYHPDETVDRGQMAAFIARSIVDPTGDEGLVGYLPPADPTFPDVTPDGAYAWCHRYIEYIASQHVVQGYLDGLYHPADTCARDQMAVYIARAFGLGM